MVYLRNGRAVTPKSVSEIWTEENLYTAIDCAVCMAKEKTGGNATRAENIAEILQKQVEMQQNQERS